MLVNSVSPAIDKRKQLVQLWIPKKGLKLHNGEMYEGLQNSAKEKCKENWSANCGTF